MIKGIAFSAAACGLWLMINVHNIQAFIDAKQRRDQQLEQVELSQKRIDRLKRQQLSLTNNGLEVERQARVALNMQLPGEKVILLKPENDSHNQIASTAATSADQASSATSRASADGSRESLPAASTLAHHPGPAAASTAPDPKSAPAPVHHLRNPASHFSPRDETAPEPLVSDSDPR